MIEAAADPGDRSRDATPQLADALCIAIGGKANARRSIPMPVASPMPSASPLPGASPIPPASAIPEASPGVDKRGR